MKRTLMVLAIVSVLCISAFAEGNVPIGGRPAGSPPSVDRIQTIVSRVVFRLLTGGVY